jgi:hypothetical protein
MPIPVTDLKPGDRVILNCPKARRQVKREAQFSGMFESFEAASAIDAVMIVREAAMRFISSGGPAWARFLLQTVSGGNRILEYPGGGVIQGLPEVNGETLLLAVFAVEPDGSMREEFGRRIFIERRLAMGKG